MSGLLDLLFGRKATPNQIPMGSPLQAPSGQGMPGMQGMPVQAPPPPPPPQAGSLVQQMAQAAPAAPSNQAPPQDPNAPIVVSGQNSPAAPSSDTWQPHKAGVLGQIADYILGTHFGRENVRRNAEGALEHLNSNPMEAVMRMAKFDPEGAKALYNSVTREQHQQAMEKHQGDVYTNMAENQTMGVLRNMALNTNPNNIGSVHAAMVNYATAKGIDPSLIDTIPGSDATIDDFKTFAQGGIPGSRQISVNEKIRNDNIVHRDRTDDRTERANYHAGQLGLGAQRVGIAKTNSGIAQQQANTAAQRAAVYAQQNQGGPVQVAPDGSALVPNKDGKTATRFMKDGRKALYIRGKSGHDWRFSHQMIGRDEKAKGVITAPEVDDIPDE